MVRNTKSTHEIYDYARGAGWILVGSGGRREMAGGHETDVVLYYTADRNVETHAVKLRSGYNGVDRFLRGYLDIGARLGPYGGSQPAPNTDYADQPRAVRMQRHAPDIYSAIGHADGFSETMAVAAAEEFGSTWDEKTDADEWGDRVPNVGQKRAAKIVAEL